MIVFFKDSTVHEWLQSDSREEPPSLDQLVSLFETLDTKMNGKIAVKDVEIFLIIFKKFTETGSNDGFGRVDALGLAATRTAAQA